MTTVQMFAFNTSIAKELNVRIQYVDEQGRNFLQAPIKFAPSSYQQTVFDWMGSGSGSAIVKAVAGSGKTTTIVLGLRFIRGITLKDIRASTFHSVGLGALLYKLGLKHHQIDVDGSKVRKLIKRWMAEEDAEMYGSFVARLVGLAKGEGIGPLVPDTHDAWMALIDHHDLYLDSEDANEETAISHARMILRLSNEAADPKLLNGMKPTVDFDDMLYLPLVLRCRFFQNDWVIVDELQDTNPVRRAIAKLCLKPGGRFLGVGDERQAIYGFTGASTDAMERVRHEFNCTVLPLTVSYRCPKAVAERVQAIVPYFEVPENAPQGQVLQLSLKDALKIVDAHDAVVCRQTRPLISLAFKLIASGVGCVVLGKEIGAGLVSLVKNQRAKGIEHLIAKLEAFRDREVTKFMAKGEEGKAEAVTDRVGCILTVIENLPETERTVPALIRKIEGLFSDDNGVLTLATIHKVKGKEYRRVGILEPQLSPSKFARQDWQQEQEINLMYVRDTRAQEVLFEIISEGGSPAPTLQPAGG